MPTARNPHQTGFMPPAPASLEFGAVTRVGPDTYLPGSPPPPAPAERSTNLSGAREAVGKFDRAGKLEGERQKALVVLYKEDQAGQNADIYRANVVGRTDRMLANTRELQRQAKVDFGDAIGIEASVEDVLNERGKKIGRKAQATNEAEQHELDERFAVFDHWYYGSHPNDPAKVARRKRILEGEEEVKIPGLLSGSLAEDKPVVPELEGEQDHNARVVRAATCISEALTAFSVEIQVEWFENRLAKAQALGQTLPESASKKPREE